VADNLGVVQGIYEAFGRGDVPAILATLADDVRWEDWRDNWSQRAGVPLMTPRTGRDAVGGFFELVGAATVRDFQVLSMMEGGGQVAVEVEIELELPGGGSYRDEEIHLWTFGADGKVIRLRHYTDTAKHIAASKGERTVTT